LEDKIKVTNWRNKQKRLKKSTTVPWTDCSIDKVADDRSFLLGWRLLSI